MEKIRLHKPSYEELAFRRDFLADAETMAYNHAYGGTIDFPEERWADWYCRWVEEPDKRFYRYLQLEDGTFVGEAAYHWDQELGEYICDVIVTARNRRKGYGAQGLALLCEAAKENGVAKLCDNIAVDNPSVWMFFRAGFHERLRTEDYILVEKELVAQRFSKIL